MIESGTGRATGHAAGPLLGPMLDEYYELRQWDKETGWPTRAKLEELGLKDAADELDKIAPTKHGRK